MYIDNCTELIMLALPYSLQVRIRREQLQAKELPSIPVMDDLMKDLGDGCCLGALLHFYFPHLMNLDGRLFTCVLCLAVWQLSPTGKLWSL